ncbi:MAG: DNA starvation/stationary phase protection protein [Planctomycetes bacterium]|nr:DNA starvation/stationary phase protection protein [Planctomycetota bacterium]
MSDKIALRLNQLLADYSVFYQKLRIYHWTVKGPMFFQLHVKFEEMYNAAALSVDEIAERIVGLGARPLGRMADYVSTSSLSEADSSPEAADMVRNLIADQRSLVAGLREGSAEAADADDILTANMLEEMADNEEKSAWMLQAYLG